MSLPRRFNETYKEVNSAIIRSRITGLIEQVEESMPAALQRAETSPKYEEMSDPELESFMDQMINAVEDVCLAACYTESKKREINDDSADFKIFQDNINKRVEEQKQVFLKLAALLQKLGEA